MKHKYHLRPWELQWHRNFREWQRSQFGLKLLRRLPDNIKERIPFEAIPLWIASILTGLFAVLYEHLFDLFQSFGIWIFHQSPFYIFVATPVFFLLAWWSVDFFGKSAAGSGIPQLMASVTLADTRKKNYVDYLLSIRVIIVKIVSSLFLLLGGGAIGREGPTLQVAGSIFETVYRLIPEGWAKVSQKIMLITGGASGLAAAFNTPLGGIVYVVEELTKSHIGKFRTAVFSSVIISGIAAQLFLGSYLYLGFPKIGKMPMIGLGWVVLLAFISGYAGSVFSLILLQISALRLKVKDKRKRVFFIILLALLFATLVFFTGENSMGTGKTVINKILFDQSELPWYTFPGRFLGSVLTFSVGGAGGIFATSLSSGASLGTLIVSILQINPEYHNILVLVCMIGFLTGVTRSPFTAAILVLEMTDRHSAIFYFLLAGIVSNLAAGMVMKSSFYEIRKDEILQEFDAIAKKERLVAKRPVV